MKRTIGKSTSKRFAQLTVLYDIQKRITVENNQVNQFLQRSGKMTIPVCKKRGSRAAKRALNF
jgi:hypothetical protein